MPFVAFPFLVISGAYAAWMDARFRRLPNALVVAVALVGLSVAAAIGGLPLLLSHLGHAAIALLIGLLLFAFKIIGGGDGKYYAAVAAWFSMDHAVQLLGWVSAAGFVLALVFLAMRLWGRWKTRDDDTNSVYHQVPFGIAIACGSVCAAFGLST